MSDAMRDPDEKPVKSPTRCPNEHELSVVNDQPATMPVIVVADEDDVERRPRAALIECVHHSRFAVCCINAREHAAR